MKMLKLITLLLALVAVNNAATANPKYFGNINVAEYQNEDRLAEFVTCFRQEGPCRKEEQNMRDRAKDIVATVCGDCTPDEYQVLRDLGYFVLTRHAADVPKFLILYNSSGKVKEFLGKLEKVPSLLNLPKISPDLLDKALEFAKNLKDKVKLEIKDVLNFNGDNDYDDKKDVNNDDEW